MSILKFFRNVKWYEYLLMAIIYVVLITLGITFSSNFFLILHSFLGVTVVFLLSKGSFIGNIVAIVNVFVYMSMCASNKLWGEIIISIFISLPINIASLINWLRNKKDDVTVAITKRIYGWEWGMIVSAVICLALPMYFLLKFFGTSYLILSLASLLIGIVAGYLQVRRSELNFVIYLISNVIGFGLWLSVVISGGLAYIVTVYNYAIYFMLNIFGFLNWTRMKKQNDDNFQTILKVVLNDI